MVCGGVYWSSLEPVSGSDRRALHLLGAEKERGFGDQAWKELQAQYAAQRHAFFPPNSREVLRVQRLAAPIFAALRPGRDGLGELKHLRGMVWQVSVVNTPELNAFCLPNGRVVVCKGLLDLLRDDDELANVLAHEIGHVVARHAGEKLSWAGITSLGALLMDLFYGLDARLTSGVFDIAIQRPHSRQMETEADKIGLTLMSRACFDPAAAPNVFRRLDAAKGAAGRVPAWLSTHPTDAERVKALLKEQPRARRIFEEGGCLHSHTHSHDF